MSKTKFKEASDGCTVSVPAHSAWNSVSRVPGWPYFSPRHPDIHLALGAKCRALIACLKLLEHVAKVTPSGPETPACLVVLAALRADGGKGPAGFRAKDNQPASQPASPDPRCERSAPKEEMGVSALPLPFWEQV